MGKYIVFYLLAIASSLSGEYKFALVFSSFILLGLVILILSPKKVVFGNEGITVTMFFSKYFIKWSDVTFINRSYGMIIIGGDDKILSLPKPSSWSINPFKQSILFSIFLDRL